MTKEEIIDFCEMKSQLEPENEDIFKNIIKSLEQEPCEDAVSRQAVFETIDDCNKDGLTGIFCSYDDGERFKKYIKNLPSVTPTRKKGKWINIIPCTTNFQEQIIYQCVCNKCNGMAYFRRMMGKLVGANLCPTCGAEMESENNE